jgi:rhamnulokinase
MIDRSVAVAAVDLGASSGRVVVGEGDTQGFTLREVHRFANRPSRQHGVLRWDINELRSGMVEGLRAAASQVGHLDAISVDGWAVDYGLLNGDGQLIERPAHYRDERTSEPFGRAMDGREGLDDLGLFEATGVASHAFNTVFQLVAERAAGVLDGARHLLLVPDLMTYWLSGAMGTELTNASTTQLLDARTRTWAPPVVAAFSSPIELFAPLRAAGQIAGPLTDTMTNNLGVGSDTQVVIGPSHDTAAAVAGVPATGPAFAFVCTGTWALVGLELPTPVINIQTQAAGFSNEVGVDNTIRLLRNVTGFWLLQECVRDWEADGDAVDLDQLTAAAMQRPATAALIDVQDLAFIAPGGMVQRLTSACRRTCGVELASRADLVRCILDSMAVAVRQAIRDAVRLTSHEIRVVHLVGGGVANQLFCQLVADACGLPVEAGPAEAASWGNVLVQARAIGVLTGGLSDLRAVMRDGLALRTYLPRSDEALWLRADEIVLVARAAVAR